MKKKFEHERNDRWKKKSVLSIEVLKIEWVIDNFIGKLK